MIYRLRLETMMRIWGWQIGDAILAPYVPNRCKRICWMTVIVLASYIP